MLEELLTWGALELVTGGALELLTGGAELMGAEEELDVSPGPPQAASVAARRLAAVNLAILDSPMKYLGNIIKYGPMRVVYELQSRTAAVRFGLVTLRATLYSL